MYKLIISNLNIGYEHADDKQVEVGCKKEDNKHKQREAGRSRLWTSRW